MLPAPSVRHRVGLAALGALGGADPTLERLDAAPACLSLPYASLQRRLRLLGPPPIATRRGTRFAGCTGGSLCEPPAWVLRTSSLDAPTT